MMRALRRRRFRSPATLIGIGILLFSTPLWADSWPPPSTKRYVSANGQTQAIIVPRPLWSNLDFFEDKAAGRTPVGQVNDNDHTQPIVYIRRRAPDSVWLPIRKWPLVNDVAPVDALVANDGKYLVTFDNWHRLGYGDDVVAIYDAHGRLIRKYALIDILPLGYIETLQRSVSSLHWGRGHFFADDDTLILRVAEPNVGHSAENPLFVSVRIRLSDGAVTPPSGRAWERALRKSKNVRAEQASFARDACKRLGGDSCNP